MEASDKFDSFIKYLLIYALIACSGIPFYIGDQFTIGLFLLSGFFFLHYRYRLDFYIVIYVLFFFILFLIQGTYSKYFYPNKIIGAGLKIISAYFVIKVVGDKFITVFVRVVFVLCLISLPIYIGMLVIPHTIMTIITPISNIVQKISVMPFFTPQIIIYTFNFGEESALLRNPGPFWEPGGFGVFLNIAIILNTLRLKSIANKSNYFLIVNLITTQSTGSYIVFIFFLFSYLLFQAKSMWAFLLLPLFFVLISFLYTNVEFLGKKIDDQLRDTQYSSVGKQKRTRFISAMEDWKLFVRNPVFGAGIFQLSKQQEKTYGNKQMYYRNNGTFNILANFGLIGFLFYFGNMFVSFLIICKENFFGNKMAMIITLSMIILHSSQMVYQWPFFWALTFAFMFTRKELKL